MKPRHLLRALCVSAALLTGCAMTGPRPATLRVRCNLPDATLWIDDSYAGRAAEWAAGQPLGPGFRRIEIRQAGYFTHYVELSPEEGQTVSVEAQLRPDLD